MSEARLARPSNTVDVVRGQYHKFMLIPIMAHHARYFDAGPVCIAVEARALGTSRENMVRGPSVHVFGADRMTEFARFDLFGGVPHYHYILNEVQHNIVWGYDAEANGPMIDWVVLTLRQRLSAMLRRSGETALAAQIERDGWDSSVLDDVASAARAALEESDADLALAAESMDWMHRWKEVHPQFNTVDY